jgi:protein SCO1
MGKREALALGALAAILAITIGWWAAALWPLPPAAPEWVVRARAACFGSTESGLPNAGGWIMLVGTPLTMLAALLIVWGGAVRDSLLALSRTAGGRSALGGGTLLLIICLGAAYARVVTALGLGVVGEATAFSAAAAPLPARQDRPAPPLGLVDQLGERIDLERFHGRPVLLTFAYGKCETVCPVIVKNTLAARAEASDIDPVVLVVTLDPWRDTPARLPQLAESWRLPAGAHLLGDEVERVEATLDAWQVARVRNPQNGEIAHPSLVYVIDREGKIAFAVTGNRDHILQALRRL